MNFHALFNQFGDLTFTGLAQGAVYALFALGYTLVYGVLRLINFAHSEVFIVGTFAAVMTWGWLGINQNSATPGFGTTAADTAIVVGGAGFVSTPRVYLNPTGNPTGNPTATPIGTPIVTPTGTPTATSTSTPGHGKPTTPPGRTKKP